MDPIYLTDDELYHISKAQRPSTQAKRLRDMGFTVVLRADGSPLVSRANYLKVTGGEPDTPRGQRPAEPNFAALRRRA